MDLPLFVPALEPGAPSPTFAVDSASGRLQVRNDGRSHIRFTDFTVQQAGRQLHAVPVFTVLPGSSINIELPQNRSITAATARVQADSNAGQISTEIAPR
jgi:P pilus assembly chaperone PapD